jgi:O-antigen/teichoic acid export membrane protein
VNGPAPGPDSSSGARSRRVLRNAFFITSFKVLGDLALFAAFLLIARAYGQGGIGEYAFAMAFTGVFAVLANFGKDLFAIRHVSQNPQDDGRCFSTLTTLSALLAPLLLAVVLGLGFALGFPAERMAVVLALGVFQITMYLHEVITARFRVREQMLIPAVVDGSVKLLVLLGVGTLAWAGASLPVTLASFPVVMLAATGFSLVLQQRFYGRLSPGLDRDLLTTAWPQMWVLGANLFVHLAYAKVDVLMLGMLRTEAEVGLYAAALRPVVGVVVIVSMASYALYPVLSRMHAGHEPGLLPFFRRAAAAVFLICSAGAMTAVYWAEEVVVLLFGPDFVESASVLRVLAGLLLVTGLNAFLEPMLFAGGYQRVRLYALGAMALANIVLNAVLIPRFGYLGAAWATLISETALLAYLHGFLSRRGYSPGLGLQAGLTLLAAGAFVAGAWLAGEAFAPRALGWLAGIAVLLVLLFSSGVLGMRDLRALGDAARRR